MSLFVCLHFSNFCLSSVADFSNTETRAPTSAGRASFPPHAKSVGHGYLSMAVDIAILANTPNQAETLLHSLERAAAGIRLRANAHKTEYMCYNQTGDISTLDGTPLKLVSKFIYLGSSVSSTEKGTDTQLTKAWKAINRLSIIWKSDLTD